MDILPQATGGSETLTPWQQGFWAARQGLPLDKSRAESEYFDGYYTGIATTAVIGEMAHSAERLAKAGELLSSCQRHNDLYPPG